MPFSPTPSSPQAFPDPIHAFVLQFGSATGSSWVEGSYESDTEAREQASARARADSSLIYAVLWEYCYGCIVTYERLSL